MTSRINSRLFTSYPLYSKGKSEENPKSHIVCTEPVRFDRDSFPASFSATWTAVMRRRVFNSVLPWILRLWTEPSVGCGCCQDIVRLSVQSDLPWGFFKPSRSARLNHSRSNSFSLSMCSNSRFSTSCPLVRSRSLTIRWPRSPSRWAISIFSMSRPVSRTALRVRSRPITRRNDKG